METNGTAYQVMTENDDGLFGTLEDYSRLFGSQEEAVAWAEAQGCDRWTVFRVHAPEVETDARGRIAGVRWPSEAVAKGAQ